MFSCSCSFLILFLIFFLNGIVCIENTTEILVHFKVPVSSEPRIKYLDNNFITDNDLFFISNHQDAPIINPKTYKLEVIFPNNLKSKFSLKKLKNMEPYELTSTINCAGNRRLEMVNLYADLMNKNYSEFPLWLGGAIGTAKWKGVLLSKILSFGDGTSKLDVDSKKLFITFEGMDCTGQAPISPLTNKIECYSMSIPFSFLDDPNYPALLAYEMNGKPLPRQHGFPLRVILPGVVGSRNVKWLKRILISPTESQSSWNQKEYKLYPPGVDPTKPLQPKDKAPPIYFVPVTSYITSHTNNQRVPVDKPITIRGYAFSGAGNDIIRVEISIDKGKTWRTTEKLIKLSHSKEIKTWTWTLWSHNLIFSKSGTKSIWVKAVDSGYNQQPRRIGDIQNYFGYLTNAFHKIQIIVK